MTLFQVGLLSARLHGVFEAIPSGGSTGILSLVRRCLPLSCDGHCTCSVIGILCPDQSYTCTDVGGKGIAELQTPSVLANHTHIY